ncbi:MAG: FAD-dependent thymidylate synthase, partial [Clostridia bacterium]|nr:FAD-dependent thymidylate synthase [Clostridia bacterium]
MKVTLIRATERPVDLICEAASICYDSLPKDKAKLVQHLYRNGHHSVFEHVSFTFLIEGVSRACTHQLVRHRHASYTQRSQRYCDESGFDVVVPEGLSEEQRARYDAAMDIASDAYAELVLLGVAKEDARMVLPNACETKLYMTLNLRELIHMANERLCSRAQWEIRSM